MALGDQLHLKGKFGEGYTLQLNFLPGCERSVIEFIEAIIPSVQLTENFAGNCVFQMSKDSLTISDLFEQVEMNKARVGIQDWGITQTT